MTTWRIFIYIFWHRHRHGNRHCF